MKISLLLACLMAHTCLSLAEDGAVLHVEDRVAARVAPEIFGQFLERPSWGGEFGPEGLVDEKGRLPTEVGRMLRELSPPVLRFPGGTDVDHMDWTDLIDHAPGREAAKRPVSIGKNGNEVTNRFGLDEFFTLAGELGSQVVLVGNLRQALYRERPLEEAARHEAGLLAYANARPGAILPAGMPDWGAVRARNGRAEPAGVRYFMVGNETYFFWPPKNAEARAKLGLADDEAAWEWFRECLLAYGRALKAVDPSVELIIDGFHDAHNPANDIPNAARRKLYLDPEIRALYSHLGAHHYAPMGFSGTRLQGQSTPSAELSEEQVWYGLVAAPGLYDDRGQNIGFGGYYKEMAEAGYRVAVTEWNFNAWNTGRVMAGRSFGIEVPARLATAGFLHGILRQAGVVSLATQSMLLGTSWDITAIRADPAGKEPPYWFPQGQVSRFYRHLTGNELLVSRLERSPSVAHPPQFTPWWPQLESLALLDALVTRSATATYVHVINRSLTDDVPLTLLLPPQVAGATWKHHVLQSDPRAPFARAMELPVQVTEGKSADSHWVLPRHSVSIIEFAKTP